MAAGLAGGSLGTLGSVGFPGRAWGWALVYFGVAVLFSPSSVGLLWFTYKDQRWRLVRSKDDLSGRQRRYFLALSVLLGLWAVGFFLVWVGHLAWVAVH